MTVCVAAIGNGMIFGASDRMITAADTEFEPPTSKINYISNSIAAMTAGDSSLQIEILNEVLAVVSKRIEENPEHWWAIKDVVDLYIKFWNDSKIKRAENSLLTPLNLDKERFISRQKEMNPDLVNQITKEMINFQLPQTETIISGIDESGPHIYVIEGGDFHCLDKIGFACIGIGARHASSQFMQARHSTLRTPPETLLLTYLAKKRGEVAPGVGTGTDMFVVGPQKGSMSELHSDFLKKVQEIYKTIREQERGLLQATREEINNYVEERFKKSTSEIQTEKKPNE